MLETTKIEFSQHQWQCLNDTSFFIAKNETTFKIKDYFGVLSRLYLEAIGEAKVQPIYSTTLSPKIAKGENYKGLPYITLDYPRILKDESNFLFIRTFFWWGNTISLQLIASGSYTKHIPAIETCTGAWLSAEDGALWDNDFSEPVFYKVTGKRHLDKHCTNLKLAFEWPLDIFIADNFTADILKKFKLFVAKH